MLSYLTTDIVIEPKYISHRRIRFIPQTAKAFHGYFGFFPIEWI
jgi:hypothetical protein